MVAPGKRRPGHSRRAQYGTFYGFLLALAGLGIGAVLLVTTLGDGGAFTGARVAATDVAAPVGKLNAEGRSKTQGFFAVVSGYFKRGSYVSGLEREVAEARVKLSEQAALKDENQRLKALLSLTEQDTKPVAIARLIGSTSTSTRRFAILGAGSRQGVMKGMSVRSPLGLVGRVLEVGTSSARILLITDTESTVPVRRAEDGVQGYAIGRGDGTLQIKLAVTGINPFKKGDAIVTSGSGGLFRPGEAIGVVVALTPDGAIAMPLSDPGMTEFVTVEPAYVQVPEPATPAPAGAR